MYARGPKPSIGIPNVCKTRKWTKAATAFRFRRGVKANADARIDIHTLTTAIGTPNILHVPDILLLGCVTVVLTTSPPMSSCERQSILFSCGLPKVSACRKVGSFYHASFADAAIIQDETLGPHESVVPDDWASTLLSKRDNFSS